MPARRKKSLYKHLGHRMHREHRSKRSRQGLSAPEWKARKFMRNLRENRRRREANNSYKRFFDTGTIPKRWDEGVVE